ncbi:MAG TPA: SsrA-binding protein SmpB [Microthrixaceae bacterium]|nr:SsrA-binding protein SmpB [Microthrixaceae bacterium]
MAGRTSDENNRVVASNRSARRDFSIEDTFECGVVLRGSEVKSLRESKVQLAEAFAHLDGGEMWLNNLHVAPYSHSHRHSGHDPMRQRKLLLHRREIDRIAARLQQERLSLVPLKLYLKDGRVKLELGLGKGKRAYDKRQDIAKRDASREAERAMGRALKGDW